MANEFIIRNGYSARANSSITGSLYITGSQLYGGGGYSVITINNTTHRIERNTLTTTDITDITYGVYLPTLTNISNLSSSTPNSSSYYRIGNTATVFGAVNVIPSAESVECNLGFSLPIASALVNTYELGGAGGILGQQPAVSIIGETGNNRANLRFIAPNDSFTITLTFQFSYLITPP